MIAHLTRLFFPPLPQAVQPARTGYAVTYGKLPLHVATPQRDETVRELARRKAEARETRTK